jgi:hypothetical protein
MELSMKFKVSCSCATTKFLQSLGLERFHKKKIYTGTVPGMVLSSSLLGKHLPYR